MKMPHSFIKIHIYLKLWCKNGVNFIKMLTFLQKEKSFKLAL
nr:MAG TPA: hypothetical protein [Caudoviricetes sp.]